MLKFKQYLTELFDKPVAFTVKQQPGETFQGGINFIYNFTVNKEDYICIINAYEYDREPKNTTYKIDFGLMSEYGSSSQSKTKPSVDINHNVVISTVVNIARTHFTHHPLKVNDVIVIKASSKSRMKLYDVIIRKFAKMLNIRLYDMVNTFDASYVVIKNKNVESKDD